MRDLNLAGIESEWHGDETRDALEQAEHDRMMATQDSRMFVQPSSAQLYSHGVRK